MPNVPLCALVHGGTFMDPKVLAASARTCLSDIRLVLQRHGFDRSANGLLLAVMALEDDVAAAQVAEVQRLMQAG